MDSEQWRTWSDARWRREPDGQLDLGLVVPYVRAHGGELPPEVEENMADGAERLLALRALRSWRGERDERPQRP